MKEKICVALDVDTADQASQLATRLSPWVGVFKIGSQLFTSEGPRVIEAIQTTGAEVFLDLKYHDIPNTVVNAAKVAARMGVFMITVHCLGGSKMLRAVSEGVHEEAAKRNMRKPLLIGITILTSISEKNLRSDLLINISLAEYVAHLTAISQNANIDGVVCSPQEIENLRRKFGNQLTLVTPGIRPIWAAKKDDQERVMTPKEAISCGANYIVLGRPILGAKSPEEAAQRVLLELQSAL